MYNIGVIGDYESICGFAAAGFDIFPVESVEQARAKLKALASGYGILYITEPLMQALQAECEAFDEQVTPCVVPIPACTGVTG